MSPSAKDQAQFAEYSMVGSCWNFMNHALEHRGVLERAIAPRLRALAPSGSFWGPEPMWLPTAEEMHFGLSSHLTNSGTPLVPLSERRWRRDECLEGDHLRLMRARTQGQLIAVAMHGMVPPSCALDLVPNCRRFECDHQTYLAAPVADPLAYECAVDVATLGFPGAFVILDLPRSLSPWDSPNVGPGDLRELAHFVAAVAVTIFDGESSAWWQNAPPS
jgi:hypothetical protein